jgi:hypothetical protein
VQISRKDGHPITLKIELTITSVYNSRETKRIAIHEGLNIPRVENFDFDENLKKLKSEKRKNGFEK